MEKVKAFCRAHRGILVLLGLVLLERLALLGLLGPEYYIVSDDGAYVNAGIIFARTGTVTIHETVSAQIMPGMPVLIGLICRLVGEGSGLWLTLKLLWIALGTLTPWFVYRAVTVHAPKRWGLAAAGFFLLPNFAWLDNVILTETPFLLCLAVMVYCTFQMAETQKGMYFWGTLIAYMAALMLKANIGLFPVFAAVYLLVKKYPFRRLLRQGIGLGCVMLCFLIPWSIRNYQLYDAFIPLTFGTGNPRLLGTYQGYGYPPDDGLDYAENVEKPAAEALAKYYDPAGSLKAEHLRKFVELETDGIKADYRFRVWWQQDPISLLVSYLIIKPAMMLANVFYWEPVFGVPRWLLIGLRCAELALCAGAAAALLRQRRNRAEVWYLLALYGFHLYLYAMNVSFSRYGESLIVLRYILLGLGLPALAAWKNSIKKAP